jgi:drug/metabolite transporter (DMT)-like permease
VAMKWSPLHLTIPLLSLIPVLTTLLAIPLLGELPGPRQWTGILLVVVGALWLNLAGRIRRRGLGSVLSVLLRERGSLLMLVVASAWSLTLPLDKIAMRAAGAPFHGLFLALGVAAGVAVAMALRGEVQRVAEVRRAPGLAVLAVVVSSLALGLQLLAMQIVWVSLVETLKRGIGNVMALLWGRFLLSERVTGGSVAAVFLMAAGVALILV